jgi:hypothetical protein
MRYFDVAFWFVCKHPWLTAAALSVILLLLLMWAAEREYKQTVTRFPEDI